MQVATLLVASLVAFVVSGSSCLDFPNKPSFNQVEKTARWMAHTIDWGVLSTISTRTGFEGQAFGNPQSFIDGSCANSTGVLYFYVSGVDQSMKDIETNNKVSFTLSEAALNGEPKLQQSSCMVGAGGDPESPLCARATFNGSWRRVITNSEEYTTITSAFFERQPLKNDWPKDHSWFIGAIDLDAVWFIDMFGGAKVLNPKDYYAVSL